MTRKEKIMKIVASGFDGVKLSLRTSLKDIKRQSVYDQIMLNWDIFVEYVLNHIKELKKLANNYKKGIYE